MPKLTPARRVATMDELTQPGDYYCLPDDDEVWFILPTADPSAPLRRDHSSPSAWQATQHNGRHRVTRPPWTFRECPDGSLEIRASIGCNNTDGTPGYYWHGYLDEGNTWRQLEA